MPKIGNCKLLGHPIFQGGSQFTEIITLNMCLLIRRKHTILQCHGNYNEVEKPDAHPAKTMIELVLADGIFAAFFFVGNGGLSQGGQEEEAVATLPLHRRVRRSPQQPQAADGGDEEPCAAVQGTLPPLAPRENGMNRRERERERESPYPSPESANT